MKLVMHALMIGASLSTPAMAQDIAAQRAQWAKDQQAEHDFRQKQFAEAGFASIDDMRAANRDVRRLMLNDPYGFLPIPAVEVERKADGEVQMTLQYRGWREGPIALDRRTWDRLQQYDAAAFEPEEYQPAPQIKPGEAPPVCHAWMAHLQSSSGKTAGWWQCRQGPGPQLSMVRVIVQAALAARPDCKEAEEDPLWAFSKCFGAKDELDDSKLEAVYSVLRKEYEEVPAADRLMEARIALRDPELKLGNAKWLEARAAVSRVREAMDYRRDRLQRLIELEHKAKDASAADRAKMRQAIQNWSQFTQSQWVNYSELLVGLAWAKE